MADFRNKSIQDTIQRNPALAVAAAILAVLIVLTIVPVVLSIVFGVVGTVFGVVFGALGATFGTVFGALGETFGTVFGSMGATFGAVFGSLGSALGAAFGVIGPLLGSFFQNFTWLIVIAILVWAFTQRNNHRQFTTKGKSKRKNSDVLNDEVDDDFEHSHYPMHQLNEDTDTRKRKHTV